MKTANRSKIAGLTALVVVFVLLLATIIWRSTNQKISADTLGFEICDNKVDDNGDGRVDGCWDPGNNYSIQGRTFNVSSNSDLTNAGANAQAGDGILINSGTYTVPLDMANAGTPDKPIIIKGVGSTRPVIRVGGPNEGHVAPKSNTIIENIKTDGIQAIVNGQHGQGGYGIFLSNVENILVKNCEMQQHEKGIRAEYGNRLIVRDTYMHQCEWGTYIGTDNKEGPSPEFKNTLWENVEVYDSVYEDRYNTDGFLVEGNTGYHVFRNCKAHGFHDAGFDLKAHVLVENCLSYDNNWPNNRGEENGTGFKIWRDGIVRNSIAYNNKVNNFLFGGLAPGNWQMVGNVSYGGVVSFEDRTESDPNLSPSTIKLSHNIFYDTSINDEIRNAFQYGDHNIFYLGDVPSSPGSNALTSDPKFVDASRKDFRLSADSPAKDAGATNLTSYMSALDHVGNLRKWGGAIDIGPYEYGSQKPGNYISVVPSPSPSPSRTIIATPTPRPSPSPSPSRTVQVPTPTSTPPSTRTPDYTHGYEGANKPPVISEILPKAVYAGSTLSFNIAATDPEGGIVKYWIKYPNGTTASTKKFSWRPATNQSGSYQAIVRATDQAGAYAEKKVDIKVLKTVSFFETRWINYENTPQKDLSFQVCRRSTYSDKYKEIITFSDGSDYLEINEPGRSACTNFYTHAYAPGNYMLTLYLCSKDSSGNYTNCFPNRAALIRR